MSFLHPDTPVKVKPTMDHSAIFPEGAFFGSAQATGQEMQKHLLV
jgi:hypothetical protein